MASPSKAISPSILPSTSGKDNAEQQTRSSSEIQDQQTSSPVTDLDLAVVEPSEKMAPRSSQRAGGRSSNNNRREADLSAILSAPQKNELVLLTASITHTMQDHLCKVFDQRVFSLDNSDPQNFALTDKNSNALAGLAPNKAPNASFSDGVLGELKKEALTAFQKWQASIVKRVSEISISHEQPQQMPQGQARPMNGKNTGRVPGRALGRGGVGTGRGNTSDTRSTLAGSSTQHTVPTASVSSMVPLPQMTAEKRQLLIHAMILLVLSLETYQAYSRSFVSRIAAHLRLSPHVLADEESRIARGISYAADSVFTEEGILKKSDEGRRERRGRSNGIGGTAIPLSLVPSLTAANIGSLTGGLGLGASAAATVLGTLGTLSDGGLAACMFFGMCGPRGSAAKTLDAFTKDVQDVGLMALHGTQKMQVREGNTVAPGDRRLRLSIGINGWSLRDDDIGEPWRILGDKSEAYALRWEQETLAKIGASINTVASSVAWQNVRKEFVSQSDFGSLDTFKWPSSLLKISKIADNPWSVGMVRADKVGIALADAIVNKVHGERGISLLGYGLGARVIYTCLMSLSERRVFGQIENVLVMGTPAPSSQCVWTTLRSVVSGRVINVFSENDFILGFLHRTGCVQFGVAGLQRIKGVYGIENVDASKPVTNHLRYSSLVGRILKDVGWEDLDMNEIKRVEEELRSASYESETGSKAREAPTPGRPTAQQSARDSKKKSGKRRLETQFQAMNIVH